MKIVLAGLASIALVTVSALYYLFNHYLADTSRLEALASGQLGRTVRIAEITGLHIGRDTRVEVRGLSIANPVWAEKKDLLRVEHLRIHLDLASLWNDGPIVISDLEIAGLRANLLAPAGREPSWVFEGAESAARDAAEGPVTLPVYVAQAHISDSRVLYRDPSRDVTANLHGQLEGEGGVNLHLEGVADGRTVDLSGQLGREGRAAGAQLSGHLSGWDVSASASLADPLAFAGLDLSVDVGGELDAGQAVDLQLRVSGSGENLRLRHGSLAVGQAVLEANGSLGNLNTLEGLALAVSANTPDLRELVTVPELDHPAPLQLAARLKGDGGRLLFEDITGRTHDGHVRGEAVLALGQGFAGSSAQLNASGENMAQLLRPWMPDVPLDTNYEVDLQARWQPPVLQLEHLVVEAGKNRLRANLDVDTGAKRLAINGTLKASGTRAHRLLESLGVETPLPDDSYLASARIALAESGEVQLRDLDLQLGSSELHGEAFFLPGDPARLRAKLVAPRLDLRFLADRPQPNSEGPRHNYNDAAALTDRQLADRVIPDTPLDFSWLHHYEGSVALRVDEIVYADDVSSQGELNLVLADGVLTSERFEWGGAFSSGQGQLKLSAVPAGVAIELEVDSRRLPLIWMMTGNTAPGNTIRYRTQLSSVGNTPAELAAALSGNVALKGTGGRFDNAGLDLILGDLFGEIFSKIDPASREASHTSVDCQAGMIAIENGLVDLTPGVVVRTDKLDIGLGGKVNLANERLNLVFNTRARTGVGISASKAVTPYVKLGGNFSHPRVGVNAKGVVVSGGLAVATGGMSIVAEGMWDRWVATAENPCEGLFSEANEGSEELRRLFGRP